MVHGKKVDDTPAEPPSKEPMVGRYVTLELMTDEHLPDLWQNCFTHDSTWDLLPGAKPENEEKFRTEMKDLAAKNICFSVLADPDNLGPGSGQTNTESKGKSVALGNLIYGGDVSPEQRTIECGALLGPALRRSYATTEGQYLLLRNILSPAKGLPYRRVVWKTNVLNLASRRCATRLGYVHEATLRNHMIDRGHSRDAAWFSIIDDDWPVIKAALEQWLDLKNFDGDGKQIRPLQEIRQSLL